MARVWIALEGKKKVWKLPDGPVYVGSGEGAQIRVDDPGAAGRHCRIEKTPDGWKVSLLTEDAPLLVNGKPVAEHYLAQGDGIKVGDTEIHLELLEGAPAASASASAAAGGARRASPGRRASARTSAGSRSSSRGGGSASRRSSRASGRRAASEEEERPRRGRRYRQSQGLPGWATALLALAGTAVVVVVILLAVKSTNPQADLTREAIRQATREGDFESARKKLRQAVGILDPQEIANLRAEVDKAEREDQKRLKMARMENDFRVHIQKFEQSRPVRVQKKKYRIFDLLVRCELYLKDFPNSPYADEVRRIIQKYQGLVDMDHPDFTWIVSMVRYPYEKSQHHKKFDRSFRLIEYVKNRYPQFNNPEQIGKLEAETLRFANMYGRKEIEKFVYQEIIQKGEKSIPAINAEIKDLDWMIKHVGLAEWQRKGKQAMKDLLEYRAKVAREIEGGGSGG